MFVKLVLVRRLKAQSRPGQEVNTGQTGRWRPNNEAKAPLQLEGGLGGGGGSRIRSALEDHTAG